MTGTTRKPTDVQRKALLLAINSNEGVVFPSTAGRGVLERMQSYGWVTTGTKDTGSDDMGQLWLEYPRITDAGRLAVGRADTIALPDVAAGDVLVYRTHPGCAIRVIEVIDGGRMFRAAYITMCGICSGADMRELESAKGYVPREIGEIFTHHAHLLRPAYPSDVTSEAFQLPDRIAALQTEHVADDSIGRSGWSDVDRRIAAQTPPRVKIELNPTGIHSKFVNGRCSTCGAIEPVKSPSTCSHGMRKWTGEESEYADSELVHPFVD